MDGDSSGKIRSLAFSSIISISLFIISIYIYGIEVFRYLHIENYAANQVFIAINSKIKIFDSQLLYKLLILILHTPPLLFGINKPMKQYSAWVSWCFLSFGLCLFLIRTSGWAYILLSTIGFMTYSIALIRFNFGEKVNETDDCFNDIEESFPQSERKIVNKYSVNLPMHYYLKNRKGILEKRNGWLSFVNVFRGSIIAGTAGSGKTFCIIEPYMDQLIHKGFATVVYDFKFPTLARKAYNYFLKAQSEGAYKNINAEVTPKFYVINFDNPAFSNRCNPINPTLLRDDADALNIAINVMLALNPAWRKEMDFFANSAMNIFSAILLFLRNYEGGKYCTFAHAVELLSVELDRLIPILLSRKELQNITKPFESAFRNNAMEQIMGQIASAQIPLARIATENVYYTCTGNDFELDPNDPLEPKIIAIGNNTQKVEAYATPLSLYFYQIIQQVNQQNKWPSTLIIDEFATIFLNNIDRLINTGRSNKVAILLGYQDNSQLFLNYGEAQAKVILNSCGNFLSGQVQGETADFLSKFFGKKIQKRNSQSISDNSVSFSVNDQMEEMFPANKLANLSQGQLVGKISDNFDQKIKEKLFNCEIDTDKIKTPEADFIDLPLMNHFDKKDAPQQYIDEWKKEYCLRFQNKDVEHIISTVMAKADDQNIYEYHLQDFDFKTNLSAESLNILKQKFNVTDPATIDGIIFEKFVQYILGKLTTLGFITTFGPKDKYYVTIWMRAIIREHYYRIKQEVEDLVEKTEQELLMDPECLKYFRVEYLQRLQKKYEQQQANNA